MRVLHIIDVPWYNACAHYGLQICRALANKGIEVIIAANPGTPILDRANDIETVSHIDFSSPFHHISNYRKLKEFIKDRSIDIVNGHRGESNVPAGLAAKAVGIPFVRTRGDIRPPRNTIFTKLQLKGWTDGIITTISSHIADYQQIMPSLPVAYIPLGIEIPPPISADDKQSLRAEWNISNDDFLVIFVARFSEIKGHDTLFRALKKMDSSNLHILLIGYEQGISRSKLEGTIPQNFRDNVHIIDRKIDNISDLMQASDAGLILSKGSEAISRTLMEYFAAGLPIIATEVGQIPEILGNTGILIPHSNPEETKKAIETVLSNQQLRNSFSIKSLEKAKQNSLNTFADQTIDFYNSLNTP